MRKSRRQILEEAEREKAKYPNRDKGIKHVIENGWDDYVNQEFPPTGDISNINSGYKTWQECLLFHDFAAIGQDMEFRYKGDLYQFYSGLASVYLVKNDADYPFPEWQCANDMIRDFKLDGKPIYERFNELEDFNLF